MNRITLFFALFLFAAGTGLAQKGTLKGKVTDRSTGEEIVGAAVFIEGTTIGSATDFMGEFTISNLDPGTYALKCQSISYEPQIKNGVVVRPNAETVVSFQVSTSELSLDEVQVVAKVNRESESMLLLEQKNAVIAIQSIGAKELSRKGVSDAEGAVTKVSGISKQEGVKNVFVRGLGDRYNATTFNGFPIPSEDPEYKNISLDFFSTDIIQSVGVNKVFSAAGTADVGGANIDILSKNLMSDRELEFGISGGGNSQTLTKGFQKLDGVNGFGFAKKTEGPSDLSQYGFGNKLDPQSQSLQINQGYHVAGGKKFLIGENKNPLSFMLIANYGTDFNYTHEKIRNTTTDGTIYQDQNGKKYEQKSNHLVLGNIDLNLKEKHRISYNLMMIHSNSQYVGDYEGYNAKYESSDNFIGFMRRQQVNDNMLWVNQLSSSWTLSDRFLLDAGLAYNQVTGLEPDRRIHNLYENNGQYAPLRGTGAQQRYFSTLDNKDLNARVGFTWKINDAFSQISNLKAGYQGRLISDNFEAVEYDQAVLRSANKPLGDWKFDDFFNQTSLSNGTILLDRNVDKYDVEKHIHAGFVDFTYQFSNKWVVNAGVKADKVDLTVNYNVNRGGTRGKSKIDELFILPSLNLKYSLSDKQSLRLGASKTYTLPQSKEISPFRYVDVNFKSQGNEKLKPSENYNVDLKWDYFPTAGELISVNAFYKYIKDPISRIEIASAGGFLSYENIADFATVAGLEIEVRKNIFSFSKDNQTGKTNTLSAGANGSYIYTNAEVPLANKSSQLEGAAPVIVNADLTHTYHTHKFTLTNSMAINYFSSRVYTIGTQGYEDIMENGVPTLDFVSSAKINQHLSFSLKAKNLLNATYKLTREPSTASTEKIVLNEYKKGVHIGIGVSYAF